MIGPCSPSEYVAISERWKVKLKAGAPGLISHLEPWEDATLHYAPTQNVAIAGEQK